MEKLASCSHLVRTPDCVAYEDILRKKLVRQDVNFDLIRVVPPELQAHRSFVDINSNWLPIFSQETSMNSSVTALP